MDYESISGLAAVLVVLVVLRIIVQRALKNPKVSAVLKTVLPFVVPPLIFGGPMFIALPASMYSIKEGPPFLGMAAFAGALALSLGVGAMLVILTRQQKEIERLEGLITDKSQ